ncbi:MAG: DUF3060 domain-containing protein [Mycobacterium sp.]|nr:DUF3060 domain-containing protein [Mycobacterium sp.]
MRVLLCATALAVLLTAGCGSDRPTIDPADVITFDSTGGSADIDCENGKSLAVGGSNNTVTVRGICVSVRVEGSDNRITVTRIDSELAVDGVNNTVSYAEGDPDVTDSGTGNRIGIG